MVVAPRDASAAFTTLLSKRPTRKVRARTYLYREHDAPTAAFFIHQGLVKLQTTGVDGRTTLIAFRGPSEVFGEHSALDGRPRMTDACVVIDATLSTIDGEDLRATVLHDPELGLWLLSTFAAHLRSTTRHLRNLTSGDPVSLVASRLGELATHRRFAAARTPRHGTVEIEMPVNHADLAAWAGVSQRSTATAFRALRSCGTISTGRMRLIVHDLDDLLRHADRAGNDPRTG